MITNDFSPPTVNAIIPQGSDLYELFTIYVDDLQTQPLDLTNFTAVAMVRLTADSPTPILTFDHTSGIILGAEEVNGDIIQGSLTNGNIAIKYDKSSTSAIRFKGDSIDAFRSLELTDTDNITRRILDGTLTITREVVR